MTQLYLLAAIIFVLCHVKGDAKVTKDGMVNNRVGGNAWMVHYKTCRGRRQSPIPISTKQTVYNYHLVHFNFVRYDAAIAKLRIVNTGRFVSLLLTGMRPALAGGGLSSNYTLYEVHFHWGKDNSVGSEHLIDSKQYAGEVQFVHIRSDLTPHTAPSKIHGYAVLSVLLKTGGNVNLGYEKIFSKSNVIKNKGSGVWLKSFAMRELLPPDTKKYYRYTGSLTTPPCLEGVVWTVFQTPVTVSNNQLARLRHLLHDGIPMLNTYRQLQPLNNRKIYRSWP